MTEYIDKITCGNCLECIPQLEDQSIDAFVTDPPYGQNQEYVGDDPHNAEVTIREFCRLSMLKLKQNGHIAVFWTMRDLDVLLDAVKQSGLTYRRTLSMYIPRGNARPYCGWLPRTQAIVIAQKYLPAKSSDFHGAMARYIDNAVEKSGMTNSQIAKSLGCDSRLVMKWTRINDPSWCLPTPRFYRPLKALLGLDDTFDILLDREPYSNQRDDLEYSHDTYVVDNHHGSMFHPAEKPLSVVSHIVQSLVPVGGIVCDGFCGSGTTAVAAVQLKRRFVCFEISQEYCEIACRRVQYALSQVGNEVLLPCNTNSMQPSFFD